MSSQTLEIGRACSDVAPLVAATGLHAHAMPPVEVHKVGALPAGVAPHRQ